MANKFFSTVAIRPAPAARLLRGLPPLPPHAKRTTPEQFFATIRKPPCPTSK